MSRQPKFANDSTIFEQIRVPSWSHNCFLRSCEKERKTDGVKSIPKWPKNVAPFVCPALEFEVIPSGECRDCLLVAQHRYFIGRGTYNWFWLLRPDGKGVGPVGEDTENFKATYLNE
jgi:hypothetical protein